jgi:hypothetical protein
VNRLTTKHATPPHNESREGFEPPIADSKSAVLTDYTTRTTTRKNNTTNHQHLDS